MDEAQLNSVQMQQNTPDGDLPALTASLEMLTVNTKKSETGGRKRICADSIEILNRRSTLRPRKRTNIDNEKEKKFLRNVMQCSETEIRNYYLNKTVVRKSHNLETIYEEEDDISARAYRQIIHFKKVPSILRNETTRVTKLYYTNPKLYTLLIKAREMIKARESLKKEMSQNDKMKNYKINDKD